MNKLLKKTLLSTACLASISTAGFGVAKFATSCKTEQAIAMVCDDEKFLMNDKEEEELAPSFVELTKWQFSNNINPNLVHLSIEKYQEGYDTFKLAHPVKHSIPAYLEQVKESQVQYFNTIEGGCVGNGHVEKTVNVDPTLLKTLMKNGFATVSTPSKVTSIDPILIKNLIDLLFFSTEQDYPQFTFQLNTINSVVDMAFTNGWTNNQLIVQIIDGVCSTAENFVSKEVAADIYTLNASIDNLIYSGADKDEVYKQVCGLIEMCSERFPAQFKVLFDFAQKMIGLLIMIYVPSNPQPEPMTPELVKKIEELVTPLVKYLEKEMDNKYAPLISTSEQVFFDILEINPDYTITYTKLFNDIASDVNLIAPQFSTLTFTLSNALNVIFDSNFDRITVWNQLKGLILVAEKNASAENTATLEKIKTIVDDTCSNAIKYAAALETVEFFVFKQYEDIRSSEFTFMMTVFFEKAIVSMMTPSDCWWYGQGGSDHLSGHGFFGYEIERKEEYSDDFDWKDVQAGDTIYEEGGMNYLGGHSGIMDGIYYDLAHDEFYVKGVEAYADDGVMVSIWDDARINARNGHIAHVNTTQKKKEAALDFAYSQLDKSYGINPVEEPSQEQLADGTQTWYCSELLNYSYLQAGVDLLDYSYANKIRGHIAKAAYYVYGYMNGSRNWHEIPGDMNALDIIAIGAGMVGPREIESSPKVKDFIAVPFTWFNI